MHDIWNPWHGCTKKSEGCKHCYMYFLDKQRGGDGSRIYKVKNNFEYPLSKDKNGRYKIKSGEHIRVCMTSDFFVEDADKWRAEAWEMIRCRSDLHFMMITKRIDRFSDCLPDDWGDGYDNVTICCTVENQTCADYRLPIYRRAPIKHKIIICEPLLERIDLSTYAVGEWIEQIVAGGESGYEARPCDFEWVMDLRRICVENKVDFWFKQTGSKLVKDGKTYNVKRQFQHSQARKAGINISL